MLHPLRNIYTKIRNPTCIFKKWQIQGREGYNLRSANPVRVALSETFDLLMEVESLSGDHHNQQDHNPAGTMSVHTNSIHFSCMNISVWGKAVDSPANVFFPGIH